MLPNECEPGTTIAVTTLHPSVAEDFSDGSVVDDLKRELRLRHQESLDRGLILTVNGAPLKASRPSLQRSELLTPIYRTFAVPTEHGSVDVELFAGTVQAETRRGDGEEIDLGDAENFEDPSEAGWYLFCNDRLLMVAERSYVTGWGSSAAAYHPQYRLFRATSISPLTMRRCCPGTRPRRSRPRLAGLQGRGEPDEERALRGPGADQQREEGPQGLRSRRARSRDKRLSGSLQAGPACRLRRHSGRSASNSSAVRKDDCSAGAPTRRRAPAPSTIKRIQYEVDIEDFERVAAVLGTANGSEVGRQTFTYFADARCTNVPVRQYEFRPAKAAQRRMIVDVCRRLTALDRLDSYQYVGFGGLEFIDFTEFHLGLGVHAMTSIEHSLSEEPRLLFNKPYESIELLMGDSRARLADVDWAAKRAIVWLDYCSQLTTSVLRDIDYVARTARPGSVLIVSVNAGVSTKLSDRLPNLQKNLGRFVDANLVQRDMKAWGAAREQKRIMEQHASSACREAYGEPIRQLFDFQYADASPMQTWVD